MFASFPLAANAKPPSRTSRSFLYDCEPKSVVKQLTAFCVVHFHMKWAAALCSAVWPASPGTGLCQPFLRMHSLQPPPKQGGIDERSGTSPMAPAGLERDVLGG